MRKRTAVLAAPDGATITVTKNHAIDFGAEHTVIDEKNAVYDLIPVSGHAVCGADGAGRRGSAVPAQAQLPLTSPIG